MSTLATSFRSLPFAQFRRHPTFYVWYDSIYGLLALGAIAWMVSRGYAGLFPQLDPKLLLGLPIALYAMISTHMFAHNASHGNFPPAVNRIVGEICGALVLSKFASWEIVHRRHHRYSDDPERDPHPAERGYWRYVWHSIFNVERQLQQSYFDLYGDTPETRRYERWRSRWSFATGLMLFALWYVVFGAGGFLFLYVPAFVGSALFVNHFNWTGHNAHRLDQPIAPADLDYGWFWLGNRIFFGIYFHGTHHQRPSYFDPRTRLRIQRWGLDRKSARGGAVDDSHAEEAA